MLTSKKIQNGVSLIELMIGLVIFALLLGVGLPSFGTFLQNSKIRNAAESIQNGLQLARSQAVTRNTSVQFTLGTGSSWTVGCVTVSTDCPSNIQSRATADGSSSAITVTAADGNTIIFSNLGRMISPVPAGGASFTSIDVDLNSTVLPSAQSRELRITVDVGGNVRMCDPNVATTDARAC